MEFALLLIVAGLAILAVYHIYSILEQRARNSGTYTVCVESLQDVQHILNQVEAEEPEAAEQRRLREAREHVQEAIALVEQSRLTWKLLRADFLIVSLLQNGPPDQNAPARFDPRPQPDEQADGSDAEDETADAPAE